eukprot:5116925-Pyramimonas_sp.AAC.2
MVLATGSTSESTLCMLIRPEQRAAEDGRGQHRRLHVSNSYRLCRAGNNTNLSFRRVARARKATQVHVPPSRHHNQRGLVVLAAAEADGRARGA